MDTDKGTSQTSIVVATSATISATSYYFTRFVSGELKGAQTISANTWNYNYACAENNANANFPNAGTSGAPAVVAINVYVWRPSTGAKVGTILDGNTAASYWEPTAVNTETAENGTFSGSSVSAADKDVIIAEIWFTTTQGNATSRNDTFYFDGTTETATTGTTVSNHASYIETPQTLAFYIVKNLVETITVSDTATLKIVPSIPQNNISGKKGTITLDTTSGVHDQSFTGVGFTPKALIIWGAGVTNEAFNEGIVHSFGMSDGTTHGAIGGGQVDASATNAHMIRNDAIIELVSATTPSTVVVRASVKTFDSDGFTLTYASKTDTVAYVFHYLAIGGSDVSNVKVKHETAATTATGNKAYTGTGFKPDAMIFANAFPADSINTNATGFQVNIGAAAGTSQFCVVNARDTSTGTGYQFNDNRVLFGQTANFQNVKLNSALVSMDTDGYTLNHIIAPTTGLPWFYLAIRGGYWGCAVFSQKTSTGTLVTPFKYDTKPVVLFLGAIDSATANANVSGGISTAIGACDASLNQGCTAFGDNGSGGNFPVKVSLTSAVIRSFTPAGTATSSTIDNEADINDMATNAQFTLDWTTANATARKLGYLVLTKTISTNQQISKSVTESVGVSDSIARLNNKTRTRTETIAVSDATTRLAAKTRSRSETVTMGTDAAVKIKGAVKALTENITTTGTLARLLSKTRTGTDSVSTTATIARLASKTRTNSESVSTTATVVRIKGLPRALSETVTIGTQTLVRLANKLRASSDSISTTATLAKISGKKRANTETVTIGIETLARLKNQTKALSESVSTSATVIRLLAKFRSLTESASTTATVTRKSGKIRTSSDSISVTDALIRLRGIVKAINDSVSTTGTLARLANKFRTSSNSITVSDLLNQSRNRFIVKTLAETVTIADNLIRSVGKNRSISQSVSISDNLDRLAQKLRAALGTTSISDNLNRKLDRFRTIVEPTISTTALTEKIKSRRVSLTESVNVSELLNRLVNKIRTNTESISVSDDVQRLVERVSGGLVMRLTETVTVSDFVTRQTGKIRARFEDLVRVFDTGDTANHIERRITEDPIIVETLLDFTKFQAGPHNINKNLFQSVKVTDSLSLTVTPSNPQSRSVSVVEGTVTVSDSASRRCDKFRRIGGGKA